jgi:hypothetical protein
MHQLSDTRALSYEKVPLELHSVPARRADNKSISFVTQARPPSRSFAKAGAPALARSLLTVACPAARENVRIAQCKCPFCGGNRVGCSQVCRRPACRYRFGCSKVCRRYACRYRFGVASTPSLQIWPRELLTDGKFRVNAASLRRPRLSLS